MNIKIVKYEGPIAEIHGWVGWWVENDRAAIAGPFPTRESASNWMTPLHDDYLSPKNHPACDNIPEGK